MKITILQTVVILLVFFCLCKFIVNSSLNLFFNKTLTNKKGHTENINNELKNKNELEESNFNEKIYDISSIRRENFNLIHVTYVHYLSNDKLTNENFKFFIDFAYNPCHERVFYTFLISVDSLGHFNLTEKLPKIIGERQFNKILKCSNCIKWDIKNDIMKYFLYNTMIIIIEKTPDLCALKNIFQTLFWKKIEKVFNFFFFINSTVRGPFLPNYWLKPWLKLILFKF